MTIFIITAIVLGIIMIIYYIRSKRPLITALKGMISGGVALVLAWYFGALINISVPLTFFNTIIALILGAPGVILIVVGKLILL